MGRQCRIAVLLLVAAAVAGPAAGTERLVPVANAAQFRNALTTALDGDVIELANGMYGTGTDNPFTIPFSLDSHITIRAATAGSAVIDGGNGGGACSTRSRLLLHQVAQVTVVFEGLVFRDGCTTAVGTSGGIDIRGGARATFVDCQFLNNAARVDPVTSGSSSGAVLVTGASDAQFLRATFSGNTSDSHGGAMLVGQGSTVFIHDSVFNGNRNNVTNHRINGLGGAIHAFNGALNTTTRLWVSNSRFEANEAAFVGGAIMAKGSFDSATEPNAPTQVLMANSTFVQNLTQQTNEMPTLEGGAIMAENNVSLGVHFSRFSGNSSELGGAISSYRAAVVVRSSEFRDNVASSQGGAIKAHSNDACALADNLPSASVDVADSFFEGNTAQFGGALFVAGDTVRQGYVQNCPMLNLAFNRARVDIARSVFLGNSVDNTSTNKNALGGALYGNLIDAFVSDSLFLDSSANGTNLDPVTVAGGAAAFLFNSQVRFTDSTFGRNEALGQGGSIFLWGGHIASFSGNVFFENAVGGGSVTMSQGAALYTRDDVGLGLDATGAVANSVFTDNDGTPIFELDTAGDAVRNRVTYSGNVFHNTTFGNDVFVNTLDGQGRTATELNSLTVGGINKAPGTDNENEPSTIPTATLLAAPPQTLPAGAAGDPAGATDAFLAWAWSGDCAELQGSPLAPTTGFSTPGSGSRTLEVFAPCGGGSDATATTSITDAGGPSASLTAAPIAIDSGFTSDLSWSLSGAPFLAGLVTHGASDSLPSGSGGTTVMPEATTRYRLLLLTSEGGAAATQSVFVDEPPDEVIFVDGFESGDTSAWN
jgi:hypothetical protein